jgi:Lrp/AsnC family transcriptional regulator, leucine-responsive regulatory protein
VRPAIDEKDRMMLDLLQGDAKIPQAEIARAVGLSPASVNERIRRLEQGGVIKGWVALLDDQKVGNEITAFVEVFIEHPRHESEFVALMRSLDEVQECHYVAGEFSCMVKIKVPDRQALRELVLDRLNSLDGVRQTRTLIVLETAKETSRMPLRVPSTRARSERPVNRKDGRLR